MKLKDFLNVVDGGQFIRILGKNRDENIIYQGYAKHIKLSFSEKMDVITISSEYLSAETSILDIYVKTTKIKKAFLKSYKPAFCNLYKV